jgi:hypothetical protein
MRKFLSILLILLITLNSFGFDFIVNILIYTCKADFEEFVINNVKESKLTIFSLNSIDKSKFVLLDDEIEYDGQMYDIVRIDKNNNDIYFYCINDKFESSLKNTPNTENEKQSFPIQAYFIQKNIEKIFISPPKFRNSSLINNLHFSNSENVIYVSNYLEVLSPPPNFIV